MRALVTYGLFPVTFVGAQGAALVGIHLGAGHGGVLIGILAVVVGIIALFERLVALRRRMGDKEGLERAASLYVAHAESSRGAARAALSAARALEQVMPEISKIGFMADSVRIPTPTVSLIILNVTFQTELLAGNTPAIDRSVINRIYQEAGENESRGLLKFTTEQNVSQDLVGEDAAVIIEGADTHTRTGFIDVKLPEDKSVHIPVTHVKIFGWYDNELGSYTNRMGELTQHIAYNL